MKKIKIGASLLLAAVLALSVLTACGGISYAGIELKNGVVGIAYEAEVNLAEGATDITYTLKDGTSLPAGLVLSADGVITGVPTESVNNKQFTVVAESGGKSGVEASFSISIDKGSLTYEDRSVRSVVDKESTATVAYATGAAEISYSIVEGVLPTGLSLKSDGSLTGVPTVLNEQKTVKITASATDCTPATAEITVKTSLVWLEFEDFTAPLATVGEYYTEILSMAKGADEISYTVKPGTSIPDGLKLENNGILHGEPTERLVKHTFTMVASADGYDPSEAEVTITVRRAADTSLAAGNVRYKDLESYVLKDAVSGETYLLLPASADNLVRTATATNRNIVKYSITSGKLPNGLTLYPNGMLYGTPNDGGEFKFTVTASAQNCEPASREFSVFVKATRVNYSAYKTLDKGEVGAAYSYDIGDATVSDPDATIIYSLKSGNGTNGLTVTSDGKVTGTPLLSGKNFYMIVVASCDGYTEAECEVYFDVQDKITVLSDGLMEAELIDLTGKTAGGYSGSASGKAIIQSNANVNASGGKYLGVVHSAVTFEFEFISSAAVGGVSINIGLSTELGNIMLTPSNFAVVVNGVSIPYGSISLTGTVQSYSVFTDHLIANNITLTEGPNTISLQVLTNTLMSPTRTGGPGIDYVKLTSSSTLSWRPCNYNLR